MIIPSKKQCTNWLKSRYDLKSTNISGCPFWYDTGFPDGHAQEVGFIEIKRGDEPFKPGQVEWLKRLDGLVYRFWEDHVDIYNSNLEIIRSIKYNNET